MGLTNASHKDELRAAGWHSRGYLPHFDGRAIPQFITLHLGDSLPRPVIDKWRRELRIETSERSKVLLQKRIEIPRLRLRECFLEGRTRGHDGPKLTTEV